MIEGKKLLGRWLWGLGIIALVLIVGWRLRNLFTLSLLSFLMAYVLNPLVSRLERLRFINRAAATIITLFGLLVGFLAVMLVIVPEVVSEFQQFIARVPGFVDRAQAVIIPWIEELFDVAVPLSAADVLTQFNEEINDMAPRIIGPITNFVAQAFNRTFSAVLTIVATLMFPVFLFFLLKDFPKVLEAVDGLIPRANLAGFHRLMHEVDESLSAFLHGQFMVMIVLGTLYAIGYSIVGIPVAIGVGLLTGMLCFIPYVGAATGFVIALFLAILAFGGPGMILGVIVVFATVQIIDATFVTPRILGGQLGLRPLWIIVALMAGAELFGFIGVLLAVPTIAVLKVFTEHTTRRYQKSRLYHEGDFSLTPEMRPYKEADSNTTK